MGLKALRPTGVSRFLAEGFKACCQLLGHVREAVVLLLSLFICACRICLTAFQGLGFKGLRVQASRVKGLYLSWIHMRGPHF